MNKEDYIKEIEKEFSTLFEKKCKTMDFNELFSVAISKINQLSSVSKEEEKLLLELGESLVKAFKRMKKDDFFKQASVAPYINRVEQIHAVMKKWYEKESEIMKDDKLDDEQKNKMKADMEMLRDQEVQSMAES